jgi:hypothetical protein
MGRGFLDQTLISRRHPESLAEKELSGFSPL